MNKNKELLAPLFRKLDARDALTEEERQALLNAAGEVRVINAGASIVREGDRPKGSTLLVHGFAARASIVRAGGRQITAFHIDGDFVDLHGFLLKTMDHSVITLSRCTFVSFPHEGLRRITEEHPHLTRLLWLSTLVDAAIHRQWLVVSGRLPALAHMAHLFMEHLVRARLVGVTAGNSYPFPLTQNDMADAMGMSAVHVNRTLQELRGMGLVEWEHGRVTVLDEPGLSRVGQFDGTFLNPIREPR